MQRLEEGAHLGGRHLRHLDVRMRHCHPARTTLDAVDDEKSQPARRQVLPIGVRRVPWPQVCAQLTPMRAAERTD